MEGTVQKHKSEHKTQKLEKEKKCCFKPGSEIMYSGR
jgi:hypothetical protein